ncbi:MAG: glycoside hydrolase family 28 protein [Granulicella sp.]
MAYAAKTCDVHAYGAKGDGVTKDTAAIQSAIDDCAKAGGGIVLLGKSAAFLSAPLVLRSNITLDIAKETTLKGSTDHDDYPSVTEFRQPARQALLSSEGADNITIRGGGVIDGQGQSWWEHARGNPDYLRPRLIVFSHTKHVLMENITAQNAAFWQIVAYYSNDLTFRNMTVLAPEHAPNTDGIDPFSSSHVLIEHVRIDTGDDNVAIKSGQPGSLGPDAPSHDIIVRNCVFQHGHGLSVGSEVAGGVQHLLAEHISFTGTDNGIRVKSNRDRGADISDLVYRNITMHDVKMPILITMFYPKIPDAIEPAPVTRLTPRFHDISLTDVQASGGANTVVIVGLPESPITGLKLTHVTVSGQKGASIQYANVVVDGFTVHPDTGEAVHLGAGVTGNLPR